MSTEYLVSWILLMGPLVLSPGPANLVFAASGAKYGVKKSIPLLIGIDLVFVIYSIIFGFGLGYFLKENQSFYNIVQVLGVAYLLYLTYKFVKSPMLVSGAEDSSAVQNSYTFMDGVILQLTNPKGWAMLITMFAVFVDGSFKENTQVWVLVFLLFLLNVSTHFLWILMGSKLVGVLKTDNHDLLVRIVFGILMFSVAIWILVGS